MTPSDALAQGADYLVIGRPITAAPDPLAALEAIERALGAAGAGLKPISIHSTSEKRTMAIIHKAVFPVAGLGTRFLPATKASPKEMLPIVDKPLIQYAAEEAEAAGADQLIFITGRNKRSIEDHFDKAYELESELASAGKDKLLDIVRNVLPSSLTCVYVRQAEPKGLGHAVLCSKSVVGDRTLLRAPRGRPDPERR